MANNWTYYEVRTPNGQLLGGYRYDFADSDKAQILGPNGWVDSLGLLDKIVRGEPNLDRLDGIPDWAYDAQGNLIR